MRWVPTPTDAYSDLRLAEAGEKAEILHRRAWDWCGHQETDGVIPAAMLARLCPAGWKQRLKALLDVGLWESTDGGYRLADWAGVMSEMRSLQQRKRSDADRQARKRLRDKDRDPQRDLSRDASRDNPHAEEKRDNPPNPPASRGANCDPDSKPHPNCRGCRTTPRLITADLEAANAAAAAAQLEDLVQRRNDLDWCGDPDCDPIERRVDTARGVTKCPACHPDVVVGPLPAKPRTLAVVGAR